MTGQTKGKFIVFEGPEGSGKTTQLTLLRTRLEKEGHTVVSFREPGGTTIGDKIRDLLLDKKHDEMVPGAELMLYMASRAQLVSQVIQPALEQGLIVLGDRFLTSTIVYQGIARGFGQDKIKSLYRMVCGDILPDLVIVLNLPAIRGLQRIRGKRDIPPSETLFHLGDRIESLPIAFHRKVAEGYLSVAQSAPDHYAIIDASKDKEKVAAMVWEEVSRRVLS